MFFSKLIRSWRLKKLQKLEQELKSTQKAYVAYNEMSEFGADSQPTWFAWPGISYYLNKITELEEKISKLRKVLGQPEQDDSG